MLIRGPQHTPSCVGSRHLRHRMWPYPDKDRVEEPWDIRAPRAAEGLLATGGHVQDLCCSARTWLCRCFEHRDPLHTWDQPTQLSDSEATTGSQPQRKKVPKPQSPFQRSIS